MVESWKKALMSGVMMWVGGREANEEGVTRQFEGRKAACVVMPNGAANVTLISGQCGLQWMRLEGSRWCPAIKKCIWFVRVLDSWWQKWVTSSLWLTCGMCAPVAMASACERT